MICDFKVPMEKYFGFEVGSSLLNQHESNGATVYTGKDLSKIRLEADSKGAVSKVVLEDGYEVPADLVVIGAGMIPNTELAQGAGLEMDSNGGVKTNPFLQTSDPDVFAAGDIASFPCWHTGSNLRIEHWINALDHGSYAAFNMLGKMVPYGNVPFFWTNHYMKGMQYVGNAQTWDFIHIDGDPRKHDFIALYVKDNKILAACG
jgi:NADPH-dependent 2,4-dienoyl-CoA reductase/sulfur reductase-like enzyme